MYPERNGDMATTVEYVLALKELIAIDSQSDSVAEQQALSWVGQQLHRLGIDYQKVPKLGENGQIEEGQYAAIIGKVYRRGRLMDTAVISDGHIDVVPLANGWTKDQGEMDGSIMYGRGTTDMKSGVVAQIEVARQARDFRNLPFDHYILVVAGEETTSWGTQQAVEFCRPEWKRYSNLAAIIPEPTSYIDRSSGRIGTKVMYGNMGCFSAEIVIRGDSGHAAASRGKANSIELGADIVHALRPLRRAWDERYHRSGLGLPVLTFTMVNAGVAPNSLPPENTLRLDGRFPIELQDRYIEDLRAALKDFEQAVDLRILYCVNSAFTFPAHPWVLANLQGFGQDKAELPLWTTDGCFFSGYRDGVHEGIPLVIAGPGFLDKLHVVDEMCDTSLILPWVQSFLAASDSYVCGLRSSGSSF